MNPFLYQLNRLYSSCQRKRFYYVFVVSLGVTNYGSKCRDNVWQLVVVIPHSNNVTIEERESIARVSVFLLVESSWASVHAEVSIYDDARKVDCLSLGKLDTLLYCLKPINLICDQHVTNEVVVSAFT